jgi:hypothetical protein
MSEGTVAEKNKKHSALQSLTDEFVAAAVAIVKKIAEYVD